MMFSKVMAVTEAPVLKFKKNVYIKNNNNQTELEKSTKKVLFFGRWCILYSSD